MPEFEMRHYQTAALDAFAAGVRNGMRNQLIVSPTGTGKTVCLVRAAEWAGLTGTTLIVAHRDTLIRQSRAKWLEAHPDDRVGVEMAQQRADGGGYDCIVSSVQTLRGERLERFWETHGDSICLIVVDESHHLPAESYQAICRRFSCLPVSKETGLRPEGTGGPVLVGYTATPHRLDKKSLDDTLPYLAYEYPLLDAMREKFLCPVRAFRVETTVDLRGIKQQAGEFNQKELAERVDVATRVKLVGRTWRKLGGMQRRTADFCTSKEQCESHAAEYRRHTPNVCVITESVKDAEREALLERFAWGPLPQVVVSVDVMTEGTDIPQLDMVMNSAPTKSAGRFMQRIGRGFRPFEPARNPLWHAHRDWPATLPRKDHLLLVDIVDTVRSQTELMTAPRILGLPSNFDLAGNDLLAARDLMDGVLERNPSLEAALEVMAETDEKTPKTFAQLKAQLQRIMLFAPNNPRGRAKEFSTLAWLAADERAIMANDADNSQVYVLNIPPPQNPQPGEVAQQRFLRLEWRPGEGYWYVLVQKPSPERVAMEREAAEAARQARREDIPEGFRGQWFQKSTLANARANEMPLTTVKEVMLFETLEESLDHVDNYVRRRHPSSLPLLSLKAGWRRRPPSPGQLMLAKRRNIPVHPDMKAGDVSDLINNHKNIASVGGDP